jgi:hypothetical protein
MDRAVRAGCICSDLGALRHDGTVGVGRAALQLLHRVGHAARTPLELLGARVLLEVGHRIVEGREPQRDRPS